MIPSDDQIRRAAYDRWLLRGRVHGFDRDDWHAAENELTFSLNYRTVVEYPLDAPERLILDDRTIRACRFCERTSHHVAFSAPRPVVGGLGTTSLFTVGVCDHCQADCLDSLADLARHFWDVVSTDRSIQDARLEKRTTGQFTLAVFQSLVAAALLIMPESELSYFMDTLEWLNNPDHSDDGALFTGTTCRVYFAPSSRLRSWISLAKRVDDHLPLPYMLCFLARGGIILQVQVPLCIRDQDLDGRQVRTPERPVDCSDGIPFALTRSSVIPLAASSSRPRPKGRNGSRPR